MNISVNLFLLSLFTVALLTGCGIKPGKVAGPQGEEKDTFERIYPDPSTFSRPESQ